MEKKEEEGSERGDRLREDELCEVKEGSKRKQVKGARDVNIGERARKEEERKHVERVEDVRKGNERGEKWRKHELRPNKEGRKQEGARG